MRQKIVVPTDFSKNAQTAVDYALTLFGDTNSELILLNTYYLPNVSPGVFVSTDDLTEANSGEQFDKELKRIHATFPNLKATIHTRFEVGDIVDVVCHFEKKDIIVMGTKGASGLTEVIVGSKTSSLVKKVDCPVFVIPENARFHAPKKILFTSDLESVPNATELNPLIDLAVKHKSKVQVLHITPKREAQTFHKVFIKNELNYTFLDIPHGFTTAIGENVYAILEDHLNQHEVDLLVMITKKGNLFHNIFHKSLTKKTAMHTDVPMLVLHK